MKTFILSCALAAATPLLAQLDPHIILQAGKGQPSALDLAEQTMRIRLMREQERMLAAQRETMSKQAADANFQSGYEAGIKDGFDTCRKTMLQGFQEYLPTLEQQILFNAMTFIFTATSVEDLMRVVDQAERELALNPNDYQKKGMVLLMRARIAELSPPPPPKKAPKPKR